MLFRVPNKPCVISDQGLNHMYERYLQYMKLEIDYRGYVNGMGWAHFFAHTSDVIKYFFQESTFNNQWLKKYLNVLVQIIQNKNYAFCHNEEERFRKAIMQVVKRDDFDIDILISFINHLVIYDRVQSLPDDMIAYVNIKNVLRELYFAFEKENMIELKDAVKLSLDKHQLYL